MIPTKVTLLPMLSGFGLAWYEALWGKGLIPSTPGFLHFSGLSRRMKQPANVTVLHTGNICEFCRRHRFSCLFQCRQNVTALAGAANIFRFTGNNPVSAGKSQGGLLLLHVSSPDVESDAILIAVEHECGVGAG